MSEINLLSQLSSATFGALHRTHQTSATKADAFSPVFETQRATTEDIRAKNSVPPPRSNEHKQEATDSSQNEHVYKKPQVSNERKHVSSESSHSSNTRSSTQNNRETKNLDDSEKASNKVENTSDETQAKANDKNVDDSSSENSDSDVSKGHSRAAERLTENRDKEMPDQAVANGLVVAEQKHSEVWFVAQLFSGDKSLVAKETDATDEGENTATDLVSLSDDSVANNSEGHSDKIALLTKQFITVARGIQPQSDATDAQAAVLSGNDEMTSDPNRKAIDSLSKIIEKWLTHNSENVPAEVASANPQDLREAIKDLVKDDKLRSELMTMMNDKNIDKTIKSDDGSHLQDTSSKLDNKLTELIKLLDQSPNSDHRLMTMLEQKLNAPISTQRNDAATDKIDTIINRLSGDSSVDRLSGNSQASAPNRIAGTQTPAQQFLLAHSMDDKDAWGAAFAKRVQFFLNNNIQHAELRLDPPELGRINVRIQMSADQASIVFNAHNSQVRDAIETAVPRLRELFNDSGINLSQVDVSTQQNFQQAQRDFDRDANRNTGASYNFNDVEVERTSTIKAYETDRLIDYYA